MINSDYKISKVTDATASISWNSANASDVSWIFVNGVRQLGPLFPESIERSVLINFPKSLNRAVEVHDFESDISTIDAVSVRENNRPLIKWRSSKDAISYRIYYTKFGDAEIKIYDERSNVLTNISQISVKSPINLLEGWHFFRVEAVDSFGNESTRLIWPYQVFRLPDTVNDLTIVNGSGLGLFDITIS